MQAATRVGDMHTCPMVDGVKPHVGGPILPPGAANVLIGGMPAARVGDLATCAGPPDVIAKGSMGVLICGPSAARQGDLTSHGGVIIGCVPTVFIGDAAPLPISPEMAAALFALLAGQGNIAFKFPRDGCYSRAHLMVQLMQQLGLSPEKVWAFPNPDDLHVKTPNVPNPPGYVEWSYHVAPVVQVRQPDGSVKNMVFDPSMFDHPVTIDEWKNAQKKSPSSSDPRIDKTVPGEPPTRPDGSKHPGSGYWPSDDPKEGPDDHSKKTMKNYKRREGT